MVIYSRRSLSLCLLRHSVTSGAIQRTCIIVVPCRSRMRDAQSGTFIYGLIDWLIQGLTLTCVKSGVYNWFDASGGALSYLVYCRTLHRIQLMLSAVLRPLWRSVYHQQLITRERERVCMQCNELDVARVSTHSISRARSSDSLDNARIETHALKASSQRAMQLNGTGQFSTELASSVLFSSVASLAVSGSATTCDDVQQENWRSSQVYDSCRLLWPKFALQPITAMHAMT